MRVVDTRAAPQDRLGLPRYLPWPTNAQPYEIEVIPTPVRILAFLTSREASHSLLSRASGGADPVRDPLQVSMEPGEPESIVEPADVLRYLRYPWGQDPGIVEENREADIV